MGVFAARAAAELQRKWAEESLRRAYDELEIRVCDRTAELSETLRTLESEIADRKRAEEELAERARQSALRSDIGLALTQGGDLSPMLQRCCEPLVEHLDAAFARIWTLNPDENMLELQASAGLYTHINGAHARVPVGRSKIGLIARERQSHLTNDVQNDPRISNPEWAVREGMVAFAGYPLIVEDRLVGVMAIFARHPLSLNTLDALGSVASQVAVGIERKKASEALHKSEERLQLALEGSGLGIWDWNVATGVTYLDRHWKKMLEYEVEEIENNLQSWERLVHPEDMPKTMAALKAYLEGRTSVYEVEFRMLSKSGEWKWIQAHGTVFDRDESGVPLRMTGTHKDISDRKQAQERLLLLERAISASSNGIVISDAQMPDKPVIYVNPAFESITGYSASEANGKNCRFLQGTDTEQPALEEVRMAIREQRECRVVLRNYRKDGTLFWNEFSISPVRDTSGRLTHFVGIQSDITEERTAVEALTEQFRRTLLLKHITEEIRSSLDLRQIFATAANQIGQLLSVDRCLIHTYVAEPEPRIPLVAEFVAPGHQSLHWADVPVVGNPHAEQMLAQDSAISSPDISADPLLQAAEPLCRQINLKSLLAVRTSYQGNPNGAIGLHQCERFRTWTKDEIDLLESVAAQVGIAIAQASLLQQEKQQRAELDRQNLHLSQEITERLRAEVALQQQVLRERLVGTMQERIRSSLNLKEVLTTAVKEVRQFLSTDRTVIYRFNRDWSGVVAVESVGKYWTRILGIDIQDNCFVETHVPLYQQGRIRAIEDIHAAGLNQCHIDLLSQFEVKANLVVPILQGEKLWGLLIAHHCRGSRQWHSSEIESLRQLSVQLAIAIQQCTLFEQAKTEIIERKRAEEALQRAKEAAEVANRAKSQFLANMSHELRTPLNAILGFSQVMTRDSSLSAEQQQHLRIINRSGEHLLELINDILEMSKIEAGRTTFNENSFDLIRLLDSLEEMFRLKAESKGLHIILDYGPDIPQYVRTDVSKLRQVLINLLENAIKFTEEGGVTLRVAKSQKTEVRIQEGRSQKTEVRSQAPPDSFLLQFEVEDTGSGIAPEEIDKLFEVFVQTETGRKSQQGTGLGLPISRNFVQLMGGDITVSSQPGRGTIFAFDVLLSQAEATEIQTTQPLPKVIGLAPDQQKYRILVVEDREENRILLVKLLTSIGFEVREAENGRDAVICWESWEPHLIWMDMRMPVMDGYEATKQIKAHLKGQATVIIALTASAFEEERNLVLSAGCDDFIGKPFRDALIFEKMAQHLGVRYVYEASSQKSDFQSLQEKSVGGASLTPEVLAAMSAEWVAALHQAAIEADAELILSLAEQISGSNAPLSKALADLVNNFQLEKITDCTGEALKAGGC